MEEGKSGTLLTGIKSSGGEKNQDESSEQEDKLQLTAKGSVVCL